MQIEQTECSIFEWKCDQIKQNRSETGRLAIVPSKTRIHIFHVVRVVRFFPSP